MLLPFSKNKTKHKQKTKVTHVMVIVDPTHCNSFQNRVYSFIEFNRLWSLQEPIHQCLTPYQMPETMTVVHIA